MNEVDISEEGFMQTKGEEWMWGEVILDSKNPSKGVTWEPRWGVQGVRTPAL